MPFTDADKPYLRKCWIASDDISFETKTLSIYPNGRAETLIQDENKNEYYEIVVYRRYKPRREADK